MICFFNVFGEAVFGNKSKPIEGDSIQILGLDDLLFYIGVMDRLFREFAFIGNEAVLINAHQIELTVLPLFFIVIHIFADLIEGRIDLTQQVLFDEELLRDHFKHSWEIFVEKRFFYELIEEEVRVFPQKEIIGIEYETIIEMEKVVLEEITLLLLVVLLI